jgi:hypothetical protein
MNESDRVLGPHKVHWVEGHGVSPVTGRTRRPHRKANRLCKAPVASGFRCSTL